MSKNVILYLTSPSSWKRTQMSLENFKQLEKLGYDIITLTTHDCLPKYFYDNSKIVIHDYTEQMCNKKHYYEYCKETNGDGYYFWQQHVSNKILKFFTNSHFPSTFRNIKTLVQYAKSMRYDYYFYCEDDHYFHDNDLSKINDYFLKLSTIDLLVFKFNMEPNNPCSSVYCSYFHLGNLLKMSDVIKNFPYSVNEFIQNKINFYSFEKSFKKLIETNKPADLSINEIDDPLINIFPNSTFNKIYSHSNIDDDSRCTFIREESTGRNLFFYHTNSLFNSVNLKIFIENKLFTEHTLFPGNWFATHIDDKLINKTHVVFNDKICKSFENLNVNDIIYNGHLV